MRRMISVLVMLTVLCGGLGARAEERALDDDQPGVGAQLGWGMASFGTNLGYIPAKLIYAAGGGLVGLLAWGMTAGDTDVAKGIFSPAFGGTWAVSPEMLRGKEPIYFNGPSYDRPNN
ncbi:MAG: hypothetical protein ABI629_21610 [bacterium]